MRCTPTSATPASAARSMAVPCRSSPSSGTAMRSKSSRSDVQAPPSAWQSLAVTGKARSAIRRATRDAARAQYGKLGREILERAFSRRGKTFSEDAIAQALARLSQKTTEDVIAAVGRGELASADVIKAAWPEDKPSEHAEAAPQSEAQPRKAGSASARSWASSSAGPGQAAVRREPTGGAEQHPDQGLARRPAGAASPRAARCPATASSAFSIRARASPSIRSTPKP